MDKSIAFTYTNWTAPAIGQLNFSTNCTIVAAWARSWLSDGLGVDYGATANHFRNALPTELQNTPSDGQLIDWFKTLLMIRKRENMNGKAYDLSNPDPWSAVTVDPFNTCLADVCQAIPWSGVPDITGPGVMTSSWIQAVLATVFALFAVWEWFLQRKGSVPGKKSQRVLYAFNKALDVFVHGAVILSLCINVAALVLISQRRSEGDGAQLALAHNMAVFSFAASAFPVLVHEEMQKGSDKSGSRYLLLLINAVIYMVAGNMLPVFSGKFEHIDSWEVYCFWDIVPTERRVTNVIIMTASCMYWAWVLIFFLLPSAFKKHFPNVAKWLRKCRKVLDIYILVMAGLLMWYMLLTITVVRQLLLQRSGFGTEDLRWSFGQILSLGTCLPVLIELYYLLKNGLPATASSSALDEGGETSDPSILPTTNASPSQQTPVASDESTGLLPTDMQRPGQSHHRVSNSSVVSLQSSLEQTPRTNII